MMNLKAMIGERIESIKAEWSDEDLPENTIVVERRMIDID